MASILETRREQAFPRLTSAQIARGFPCAHAGPRRDARRDDVALPDRTDRGHRERHADDVPHVFLMTDADPQTRWIAGCLALDDKGFVRTGTDLRNEDLGEVPTWRARSPYLLETSLPGVFAVGDVRSGSVKRVAVGEESTCIQFVHRVLAA